MTQNEGKILKYLQIAKGKASVKGMAKHIGFEVDYTRLMCRSLERRGHLTIVDASSYTLSSKDSGTMTSPKETKKKTFQAMSQTTSTVGKNVLKAKSPQEKAALFAAGNKSIEDVARMSINWLARGFGIRLEKAAHWINQERRQTGMIGKGS